MENKRNSRKGVRFIRMLANIKKSLGVNWIHSLINIKLLKIRKEISNQNQNDLI